jgi:hypothetical protein
MEDDTEILYRPVDGGSTTTVSGPAFPSSSTIYKPYRIPTRLDTENNASAPPALLLGRPTTIPQSAVHEIDPTERSRFTDHDSDPDFSRIQAGDVHLLDERFAWQHSTRFPAPTLGGSGTECQTQAIRPLSPEISTKQYVRGARHLQQPWETGSWKRFPWMGFGALLTTILRKQVLYAFTAGTNWRSYWCICYYHFGK